MALNVTNLRCHWSDCRGKKANSRLKEEDKHERCPVRGARYMLFLDWWVKIVHWYHGCDLIRTLLAGVVVVQCSVDLLFCQLLALRMKIYKSHTHETAFLELYFGGVFEIPTWTYLFTLFHFIFVLLFILLYLVLHSPGGYTPLMLITGRLRDELQPLPFYVPFLREKVSLSYTFYWQKVPLSHTNHTPPCIAFNCKCTVV